MKMLGWTVALLVTVLDMFRKIISLNKENYWFKSLYFSSFCIPILLLVSLVTKNEYIFFLPLFWTSIPLAHVFGWIHLYESGGWFPDIQPLGYLVWYLSFVVLGLIIGLACDYFIRKKHGYQLLILTSSVLVLSLYVLYALTTLPPTKCHFVFEGKYMDNRTSCYLEVLRIDESLATTDFCNTKLKPHPENSESVHNYFSCLLIVARNTGDTEICTQIATFESKFSSEDEYIECIGSLARNEHETSRCSQFDEDWVAFRQCLESVNDTILTTNACTKFTVPWQHDMCLGKLAFEKSDLNLCEEMILLTNKEGCYQNMIRNNMTGYPTIETSVCESDMLPEVRSRCLKEIEYLQKERDFIIERERRDNQLKFDLFETQESL